MAGYVYNFSVDSKVSCTDEIINIQIYLMEKI